MWKLNNKKGNKGFTLTELIVTMSVLGILASLAVVGVGKINGTTRQTTCVNNLRSISQALQLYYNDFRVFPDDGYPDDANDTMPLSTELAGYLKDKSTFVCPEDNDKTSTGNFASYDPYYVARKTAYGENELAIGCPRHRDASSSTSLFTSGGTEVTKTSTVLANGQEIPPDGTTAQRTISNVNDTMTFNDGSTVTITNASGANYGCFLVQSVILADGTLYSIIKVQDDGDIDVQVTSGSKFEIVTPSAIVGVRGTQFTVTTTNLGLTTDVVLTTGTVVLMDRDTGKTATLTDGGTTEGTVDEQMHSHAHWHADGTYHEHSHGAVSNAHHGNPAAGKRAAAESSTANEDNDEDGDGYTIAEGDCNDSDSSVNPGATEIPGNGIDENCNGDDDDQGEDDQTYIDYVNDPENSSSDVANYLVANSPLSDDVLIAMINRTTSLSSGDNENILNLESNNPLSDNVLVAAINHGTLMDKYEWTMQNNSPLSEYVINTMINKDSLMASREYKDILVLNSPLSDSICVQIYNGTPPMTTQQKNMVLNANPQWSP